MSSTVMSKEKTWVYLFVTVVFLSRICQGISISIIGPTLLYLAANAYTNVASITPAFTGRGLGVLIGSILSGVVIRKIKPLSGLAFSLVGLGAVLLIYPFVNSVGLLIFIFSCFGIFYGYLDAGQQALFLKIWGQKESRVYIQAYHFGFTVGAVIGPLLARPFLVMGKVQRDDATVCPNQEVLNSTIVNDDISLEKSFVTGSSVTDANNAFNVVGWAYIIPAIFIFTVSVLYCFMAYKDVQNLIENIRKGSEQETEMRKEDKLRNVWKLFLSVIIFYVLLIGSEHSYMTYIYSIVVCQFGLTESDGSLLNTIFWIGMSCGRLSGTVVSKYWLPRTIIIISLVGCLSSLFVLSLGGPHSSIIPWITSFTYSFFVAPLYPAGVSWVSRITNISGRYLYLPCIGGSIGAMLLTPIGGVIFQKNPMGVLYLSTALIFVQCIVFGVMTRIKRKYLIANKILEPEPEEWKMMDKENTN